ncbi:hypothetical protein CIW57_23780 [Enterobacter cloacae]|nr:hypothetical protein CIW57_23780 [Enterobacter cloacae]
MKKRVIWWIRRRNQSHSPGCIAIHCARIHPLRFWRLFGWFVACFTVLPSETRSARLSGARKKRYVQYAWLKSTQKSRHKWRLFCYKFMIINHKSTFFTTSYIAALLILRFLNSTTNSPSSALSQSSLAVVRNRRPKDFRVDGLNLFHESPNALKYNSLALKLLFSFPFFIAKEIIWLIASLISSSLNVLVFLLFTASFRNDETMSSNSIPSSFSSAWLRISRTIESSISIRTFMFASCFWLFSHVSYLMYV